MNRDVEEAIAEVGDAVTKFKAHHGGRLDEMQEQIDRVETVMNRPGFGGGGNPAKEGTAERQALATLVRTGDESALLEMAGGPRNTLRTDIDTSGGYVLAPSLSAQIVAALRSVSPMHRLARSVTIGLNAGGEFVEPRELGEVGAQWVSEHEERAETGDPSFGATRVLLHELYAVVAISQRMLDDSLFDLGTWVQNAIAAKFARTEGVAFITGDGVKRPQGILSYGMDAAGDATRSPSKWQTVPSGSAAAITADGLIDLFWALGAPYRANACWLMSSATAAKVDRLKEAGSSGQYLWRSAIAAGEPPTLLGRPVYIDESMPAEGADATPIAFGDWARAFIVLDRPGVRILRDPYTRKGHTLLYAYRRTGGGASDFSAAKFLKCSTS